MFVPSIFCGLSQHKRFMCSILEAVYKFTDKQITVLAYPPNLALGSSGENYRSFNTNFKNSICLNIKFLCNNVGI